MQPRKHHFFKVLLGDFSQRLKIPTKFLKHISRSSKRVTLEGPSGKRWHVELKKTIDGTFLSDGWTNFVEDHTLNEYEFLVFRYEGGMHFTVQVFDRSACEREDLSSIRPSKEPISGGKNKLKWPAKCSMDVGFLIRPQAFRNQLQDAHKDDVYPLETVHDDCPDTVQGSCVQNPKTSKQAEIKTEDDELPLCVIAPGVITPRRNRNLAKGFLSRKLPVTNAQRLKARQAAHCFTSNFPSIAVEVYLAYMMRFPNAFARAHLPQERTEVVLRDPNGKTWMVLYIPSGNVAPPSRKERGRLSAGWAAFTRGNNLEEGDYCVFELIAPLEFCVRIFKVASVVE